MSSSIGLPQFNLDVTQFKHHLEGLLKNNLDHYKTLAKDTLVYPDGTPIFSQEELDWRAANASWNLRRDFKTNTSWDRECVEEAKDELAE